MDKLTKGIAALFLVEILAVVALFLGYGAMTDAPVMDELAHIPAGYGYVHALDYRLNPEHPPLLKAIAAAPLLLLPHLNFPTNIAAWKSNINGQWDMGTAFLYHSGNDAMEIVRVARIGPILVTLFLIFFVYFWARKLIGRWWAFLPTTLVGLSPIFLAHGHYVTTDVAAAVGILTGTYFFLKALFEPTPKKILFSGLAFGIASLMKFSTVLLVPFFILLSLVFIMIDLIQKKTERGFSGTAWFGKLGKTLLVLAGTAAVGYILVVYPVYFLFTRRYPIDKQAADTTEILGSFGSDASGCHGLRCVANLDITLAQHDLTRPFAEYLLGILMVFQRTTGGNTSYFLGEVSNSGSRWYFPTVYGLKTPLPELIIVLTALFGTLISAGKRLGKGFRSALRGFVDYISDNFEETAMVFFVLIYWVYSIRSPLNIGVRHLIPTIPFIAILSSKFWKRWVLSGFAGGTFGAFPHGFIRTLRTLLTTAAKYMLLCILVVWFLLETLIATPYFLSSFNELGGGVSGGYRYVTDSNYDWGQDLLRLEEWVKNHPEANKIAVDYFGGGNPRYFLGEKEVDWSSSKGSPAGAGIHWLAVSVNTLTNNMEPMAQGETRDPESEYRWLAALRSIKSRTGDLPEPDARAGTSIFIYRL